MKTNTIVHKAFKGLLLLVFFFSLLTSFSFVNKAYAADPDCPQGIQDLDNKTTHWGNEPNGTFNQGNDNGKEIPLNCPSLHDAEHLVIKAFFYLIVIVGLVLAFAVARAGILMIISVGDPEKFAIAAKSIVTSILATVALFFSYIFITFILVGFLGLGLSTDRKEWNIVCQQGIVFNLTFGDSNGAYDPCAVVTP